jgi:hypothetical protein
MNWSEKLKQSDRKRKTRATTGSPTSVRSLSEIPIAAKHDEMFRIEVEIERITERTTSSDEPCYFIACRDEEGQSFSIVVWHAQMDELEGTVDEGMHVSFDVRVPKPNYTSFTLA